MRGIVEPRFTEPLYNEVLGITNDFLYPSNSKIYERGPRCNETLLWRSYFASPLALRYFEVPLYIFDPALIRGPGFNQENALQ